MRFIRFALFTLLFIFTLPIFAQTIDPTADLDETYTLGALTLRYPTGMSVTDDGYQIFMVFDEEAEDYINLATPESFDYFGVDRSTLEIATQNVYQTFADSTGSTVSFADAVSQTTIGGYEAYTFTITAEGFTIVTYAFSLNDAPYVISLFTQEVVMPLEDELVMMTRIVESMVIEDVSAEATSVFTEITPEATAEPLTLIPRDIPAGASDVLLGKDVVFGDGEIAFSIPETWSVDDITAMIGTSDALLDVLNGDVAVGAGELALQVIVPSRVRSLDITPITLDTVMTNLIAQFENPQVYQYTDWKAYYIPVVGEGIPTGAFFMIMQIGEADDDVLAVVGVTDNFDEAENAIIAIIKTVVSRTEQPEPTEPADTGASPEVTPAAP